jgi:hypothetical protein
MDVVDNKLIHLVVFLFNEQMQPVDVKVSLMTQRDVRPPQLPSSAGLARFEIQNNANVGNNCVHGEQGVGSRE